MSAWLLNPEQYDLILTARRDYKYQGTVPDDDTLTEMGLMLLDENLNSIRARYSENPEQLEECKAVEREGYRFREFPLDYIAEDVLKALCSYRYQSCEHEGWGSSSAKAWVQEFIEYLERKFKIDREDSEAYESSDGWYLFEGMNWRGNPLNYRSVTVA